MPRGNDGSANSLAQARAKARTRPVDTGGDLGGPDWPNIDEVTLQEALEWFEVQIYAQGCKLSLGLLSDNSAIFCRVSYPKWADNGYQGLTTFTASDELGKAVRKAYAHHETTSSKVWKVDQFAR